MHFLAALETRLICIVKLYLNWHRLLLTRLLLVILELDVGIARRFAKRSRRCVFLPRRIALVKESVDLMLSVTQTLLQLLFWRLANRILVRAITCRKYLWDSVVAWWLKSGAWSFPLLLLEIEFFWCLPTIGGFIYLLSWETILRLHPPLDHLEWRFCLKLGRLRHIASLGQLERTLWRISFLPRDQAGCDRTELTMAHSAWHHGGLVLDSGRAVASWVQIADPLCQVEQLVCLVIELFVHHLLE